MKWWPDEPQTGDMIRVPIGSIFHYGIFINAETVVQFGPPPGTFQYGGGKDLKVCITSADEFSCGNIIETALLDSKEEKKRIPRSVTAKNALSRVGEGGYDLIHNNCEHFAYECIFGVRRCTQEEDARKRWNNRPILDCYFAEIPEQIEYIDIYPEQRRKQIEATNHDRLRRERIFVWKVLSAAAQRSFSCQLRDLDLRMEPCGRWTCSKFHISITHTEGLAAVAVSNAPVGIDAENTETFISKYASQHQGIAQRILTASELRTGVDDKEYLLYWTRKESIFKSLGKRDFHPHKIKASEKNTVSMRISSLPSYVCSVHGAQAGAIRCYSLSGERTVTAAWESIEFGK